MTISKTSPANGAVTPDRPLQTAIAARRTLRRFNGQPVPREVIERLLTAAVQAPNHHRTQPWRFFVVDGSGSPRQQLAEFSAEMALGRAGMSDDAARARAEKKRAEVLNTPVLIFVYAVPGRNEVETRENYAAVCCGVQNLLLAAVEEGLASSWSTGGLASHPALRDTLGADPAWQLAALLYIGYPEPTATPAALARPGATTFTRWLSEG